MFKTSSCICTKVSLRNSTCNVLLHLSMGKRGSVISGAVKREWIEFMMERPSRDPHVNALYRFGARCYKNTFESLHLHIYILRLLFLSTWKGTENKELIHVKSCPPLPLMLFMCCWGEPVSWFSNIDFLFWLQQNQNYDT